MRLKHYVLLGLLFGGIGAFHNVTFADTIECKYKGGEIIEREGLNYIDNTLVDGLFCNYFESGKIERAIPFKKGLRDGVINVFYEAGMLKAEQLYQAGMPLGAEKEYYESGKLKAEKKL